MTDRGRLIAPGGLREELAELAARHGLRPSSVRPTLGSYLRQVWKRRHFIEPPLRARRARYSIALSCVTLLLPLASGLLPAVGGAF